MFAPVLSRLGCVCALSVLLLLLSCPGRAGPIAGSGQNQPDPPGARGAFHSSAPDQEGEDLEVQGLLGQLLSVLDLTELGPQSRARPPAPMEPPEHMLELYHRLASDRTAKPSASTVRSFNNQDSSPYSVTGRGTRTHPLLFNVSLPRHERIAAAELRLHGLVQRDRRRHAGVDRKVTVYKIHEEGGEGLWSGQGGPEERGREEVREMEEGRGRMEELVTWDVRGEEDAGWLSFDLTRSLRRWQKTEDTAHRLEVHIASVDAPYEVTEDSGHAPYEVTEDSGHAPYEVTEDSGQAPYEVTKDSGQAPYEVTKDSGQAPYEVTKDSGRAADVVRDLSLDGNKHTPVIVVFSDDRSRREDERELGQTIGRSDDPQGGVGRDGRTGGASSPDDERETDRRFLARLRSDDPTRDDRPPPPRRGRTRRHVDDEPPPCGRTRLHVEFKDIGWDSWVIQPPGYEAYRCHGACSAPMTAEVSPTKHAIIQTLLSMSKPRKASRACCVPTKLEPISLLYYEDGGVVTYKHKYEGMVVAECGCR